jgi:hypothetical protein
VSARCFGARSGLFSDPNLLLAALFLVNPSDGLFYPGPGDNIKDGLSVVNLAPIPYAGSLFLDEPILGRLYDAGDVPFVSRSLREIPLRLPVPKPQALGAAIIFIKIYSNLVYRK